MAYGDDAGLDAFLTLNGLTWPAIPPGISKGAGRQRGSSYIDGVYGERFPGYPTDGIEQEDAWPRTDATAYRTAIATDAIPARVVTASYWAAYYAATRTGGLGAAFVPGQAIKREKVEGLEVEYFEAADGSGMVGVPLFPEIEGLLAPLLIDEAAASVGLIYVV